MNNIINWDKDEEIIEYVRDIINEYHLERWKKEGKSQSIKFIEFVESDENNMLETEKAWKNLTVTNKVFKIFCIIQENAFITKYKMQ